MQKLYSSLEKDYQGAPKGRQQKGETGPGTHIFADFCRFLLIFGSLCKSRDLGVADLRRKPQETADFRRKPQKTADFCRNRFSHLLSPFWRAPRLRGNTIRGKRTESLQEENLPPGGSPRGLRNPPRSRGTLVMKIKSQKGTSEVFRGPLEDLSRRQISSRRLSVPFQGAPKGRQQKGETGPGTHIFADFCRFLLIFGSLCKSRDLGVADLRRKPQIFAGNRRKPQIFAETGFSHLLSPFWRAPTGIAPHCVDP